MALYQRFGLLAVVVPSLLPPPTPFKIFVLMAGAAAVAPWRFGLAIVIGRGIRYFGQGYLAVRYGERAVEMVKANGAEAGIGLAVLALAIGLIVLPGQASGLPAEALGQIAELERLISVVGPRVVEDDLADHQGARRPLEVGLHGQPGAVDAAAGEDRPSSPCGACAIIPKPNDTSSIAFASTCITSYRIRAPRRVRQRRWQCGPRASAARCGLSG